MSTRSKKDIIDTIAEKSDVTKKAAGEALDMVLGAIGAELKDGHTVQLHGFGTFTVKHTPERPGRNPITGQAITISARSKASFKQAKALLEG